MSERVASRRRASSGPSPVRSSSSSWTIRSRSIWLSGAREVETIDASRSRSSTCSRSGGRVWSVFTSSLSTMRRCISPFSARYASGVASSNGPYTWTPSRCFSRSLSAMGDGPPCKDPPQQRGGAFRLRAALVHQRGQRGQVVRERRPGGVGEDLVGDARLLLVPVHHQPHPVLAVPEPAEELGGAPRVPDGRDLLGDDEQDALAR